MKWSEMFTSSVGKKWVMALTGLFLITFLVVHVGLNACIWANDGGAMFNAGAHFMGSMVVIRIIEIGISKPQQKEKRICRINGQQRKQMVQP
jgi:succinate dehydrogenase / fumarate reductase cytochrome b subunit